MKVKRKIIEIDEEKCDGCGQCVVACAEGSLEIIDGKAKVISDNLCDGLGACIGECPQDALEIIEREAEEFDEEAVEKHLATRPAADSQPAPAAAPSGGCPSAGLRMFQPAAEDCQSANRPVLQPAGNAASELSHWPVQIRLIPPTAPFLKGADILVVADCVPIAFPSLHQDFMKGRVVMVGCPKFDDAQSYMDKFAEIFSGAGIKSITTVMMEVPCCSGLSAIVRKALDRSGQTIPLEEVTIGTRGQIVARDTAP
jgi:NAD-dependent dihydropyrimidine dehydrogenase PreA subunit